MANVNNHEKQERYPGERFELINRIPFAARRVLLIGAGKGELGYMLRKRAGVEVHGIEQDPSKRQVCKVTLDVVYPGRFGDARILSRLPNGFYDAVVILDTGQFADALEAGLQLLKPCLARHAWVFLALQETQSVQPDFDRLLVRQRYLYYDSLAAQDDWPKDSRLYILVDAAYALAEHVDQLLAAGFPDRALHLLELAPDKIATTTDQRPYLMALRIKCLRHWSACNPPERLAFLYKAYELFSETMLYDPYNKTLFEAMADYWASEGMPDIAARFMRILRQSQGEPKPTETTGLAAPSRHEPPPSPPRWTPRATLPHILYVIHPNPHYGIDVLYDGLCEVLGDENVVDFPYKPTLHGEIVEKYRHYPCNANRQGRPKSLDMVLAELRSGAYDLVVFADCEIKIGRENLTAISAAAGDTPLCLVDATDTFDDMRLPLACAIDISPHTPCFKREMMTTLDYGINTFPMPFAYMDCRAPGELQEERDLDVFWAGQRAFGTRRHYLEYLEKTFHRTFGGKFTQEAYTQALGRARIGLNLAGAGFDTVRYWELPAHGAMLLSERLPIHIPFDFEEDKEAVYFSDLHECAEKLRYYLEHPEEAAMIARAGRDKFLNYHTASARARQFLAWMRSLYPDRL